MRSTVVVATGPDTEVGQIATMVGQAEAGRAPLQEGLDRLGRTLSIVVVGLTGVLIGIGLRRGVDVREVLEVATALAVAGVPEGLPAVAALTVGVRRMAQRHALVRRLPTVGCTARRAGSVTGRAAGGAHDLRISLVRRAARHQGRRNQQMQRLQP